MAFLAKHGSVSEVVGVEGIRKALEAYAEEQPDLEIKHVESPDMFERFVGKKTTLLKGDFFALDSDATGGKFDSIWDRGSMVAIDPHLRASYVNVMKNLLKPGGTILLVTLERRAGTNEAVSAGPPFSLSEEQVRALYESQDWVDSVSLLDEIDEIATSPEADVKRFTSSGVTSLFELTFEIRAKP
jgi:thiopurine S-methyltransferase